MHEDNDTVQEEVPMKLEDPPVSGGGGGGVTVVGATWSGGPAPQQSSIVVATPEDTKDGIEELCPVCGDKVSGYHYGLLTCESCKGFFKRTVQNKKVYTCVAERQCHIDKTQRKRCPFCRFQKCLEVGMKLEAVRADRMRGGRNKFGPMYKRDRARKLQLMRQRQMALGGNSAGALPGVTNAGAISGVNTGGINTGNNINSGGMGVVSGVHQQGIGSVYQGQGQFHIKQEIQIPQVSSLTSSPDSSPSPISVALGQIQQQHHHVPLHHAHHHQSGGAGPSAIGASGGGALMMVDTKLWPGQQSPKPYLTTTPPPGAEHTSPTSHSKLGGGLNVSGANGGNSSVASGPNIIGSGGNGNVTGSSGGNVIGGPVSGAGSGCAGGSGGLVRELVQAVDDREWQSSLYGLLQNQTYNQCEVDLFELMCKVLDQNLFSQVDWARNSVFFKDLKVDDQMKLLQHSWSDMLVLDHVHQRLHNSLPDETSLPNGQRFDLLSLGLLGVTQLADRLHQLSSRLQQVKWDVAEYICVKFMLLLNPDVRGISNRKHVQEGYEQVQLALQEYTATCYPQIQDKFNKLVSCLPEIHCIASRGEEHLYVRHCAGGAPTQTLLMEMLHAKRK